MHPFLVTIETTPFLNSLSNYLYLFGVSIALGELLTTIYTGLNSDAITCPKGIKSRAIWNKPMSFMLECNYHFFG